jgi:2'-5' RNA ligase
MFTTTDPTLPGKSLEAQFDALWQRFLHLSHTADTINRWSARWQRWLTPVNVSFIVPIEDEAVCCYLGEAQAALLAHMNYAPQPPDKLHITLYHVGYLRNGLPLPGTWTQRQLERIASIARANLALIEPFDVQVGPINAFPNVPIAEVHDDGKLRLLRAALSQATPRQPRRLPSWPLIPHVTLGYFGRKPAAPIQNAIKPLRRWSQVALRIDQAHMTSYRRKPGPHQPSQALHHSVEEVLFTLRIGGMVTPGAAG